MSDRTDTERLDFLLKSFVSIEGYTGRPSMQLALKANVLVGKGIKSDDIAGSIRDCIDDTISWMGMKK